MLEQIILLCKNNESSLRNAGEMGCKIIRILVYIPLQSTKVQVWVFEFYKFPYSSMVYLPSLAHIIKATNVKVTGQKWTRKDVGRNIVSLITSSIVDFAKRFWRKIYKRKARTSSLQSKMWKRSLQNIKQQWHQLERDVCYYSLDKVRLAPQ